MDDALNDSIQKSLEYSEDSENLPLKGDDHTEPGPDDDLDPKVGLSDDSDYDSDEEPLQKKNFKLPGKQVNLELKMFHLVATIFAEMFDFSMEKNVWKRI